MRTRQQIQADILLVNQKMDTVFSGAVKADLREEMHMLEKELAMLDKSNPMYCGRCEALVGQHECDCDACNQKE